MTNNFDVIMIRCLSSSGFLLSFAIFSNKVFLPKQANKLTYLPLPCLYSL